MSIEPYNRVQQEYTVKFSGTPLKISYNQKDEWKGCCFYPLPIIYHPLFFPLKLDDLKVKNLSFYLLLILQEIN